jgi:hypothetical protein
MPKAEALAEIKKLNDTNPALAEKVVDVLKEDKLGLTRTEQKIKSLGVTNGDRAEFLVDKLSEFKTKEEKLAYIKEMTRKKVITDKVWAQMKAKLAEQKK